MQGSKNVIAQLNQILTCELTSINQYFLHARMAKNWGFEALNKKAYKKSILDMKQADDLIERILLLEGLPNLQHLDHLKIGESPEECLNCDLQFQNEQLATLRQAIELCEKEADYVSRELLENILEAEEEYTDWLETQEHMINNTGIQNYLQSQIEG